MAMHFHTLLDVRSSTSQNRVFCWSSILTNDPDSCLLNTSAAGSI